MREPVYTLKDLQTKEKALKLPTEPPEVNAENHKLVSYYLGLIVATLAQARFHNLAADEKKALMEKYTAYSEALSDYRRRRNEKN